MKQSRWLFAYLLLARSYIVMAQIKFPLRIDSGSKIDTRDINGVTWISDVHFTAGFFDSVNRCTAGQFGPQCSIRTYNAVTQRAPYGYSIPLPNSEYTVRLHFMETFWSTAGSRLFNIVVEGSIVFPRFDIAKEAGGKNKPFSFQFNTTVVDSNMNIQLVPILNNPMIAGVEIFAPPNKDMRINCGGPQYVDRSGRIWMPDQFATKGNVYVEDGPIAKTLHDTLYNSEHYFNGPAPYFYQIPVKFAGRVMISLHFAEIFHKNAGFRVFDIWVEGVLVRSNFDIFKEVGYRTAYVIEVEATVNDGFASIELVRVTDNPKISAIEVVDVVNYEPPTNAPTISPAPSASPTTSLSPTSTRSPVATSYNGFKTILVNCGGLNYVEKANSRLWKADYGFTGGSVFTDGTHNIANTIDDDIYHSERNGAFKYTFAVPVASYEITLHFAELYWQEEKQRVFDVIVENTVFNGIDIVKLANGPYKKITLTVAEVVADGFLNIECRPTVPAIDLPKLSGIEVKLLGPHLAHAVSNGPYFAADTDRSGTAVVSLNARPSHTHGTDLFIVSWTWKEGATTIGVGASVDVTMSVGNHDVSVTIVDSGGNVATDETTVTVFPFGHPVILSLSQTSGYVTGGYAITLTGVGFTYTAAQTIVKFGLKSLTDDQIQIIDDSTISLLVPIVAIATPVQITVQTPMGISGPMTFNYVAAVPIQFSSEILLSLKSPTAMKFGPDEKLYVGTIDGKLAKLTLNSDHTAVVNSLISNVSPNRAILGIAFDPLDSSTDARPYISTNYFFHGESKSSSGNAINGDIRRISGANLDEQTVIISGLPVADHDHGVNQIEFGDNGELYIQIGSNTNGGVPGPLTGKQIQKENYFSAATLVAYLSDPMFNGAITYDAADNGSPTGARGIEVFAAGLRNPFGIVLHSNGNLYATDNGPNNGYGNMQTGCGPGQQIPDKTEPDKLLLVQKGKYYGHPNTKRAIADNKPNQCTWRSGYEPTDETHESPLLHLASSMNGIIEWESNHFFGQLRNNLIISKYTQGMFRVILGIDGRSVIPESDPALNFIGNAGLDIVQSPSGTLIEARLVDNSLFAHKPIEPTLSTVYINAVFPRRGGTAGGNTLKIYGVNFNLGNETNVRVGGSQCPTTLITSTIIACTLPGGSGTVDIVVTTSEGSSSFLNGYRYITGLSAK